MTWLEKFHKEHQTLAESYIVAEFCPEDGLVSMCPSDSAGNVLECEECWNRRMPEDDLTEEGPDRT